MPIPKTINENRLVENINVFDFELTEEDHEVMDSFNTGERLVSMSDTKHSKYWPFELDF